MSELKLSENATSVGPSSRPRFWNRQLPYLLVLVLAIAGVAYTNISHGQR